MKYTKDEVLEYVAQEDVRFIRLAFCDVFGRMKNIAIMPTELPRAFAAGVAIDASAISGFGGEVKSDLFLHPDPATLSSLPWRSENGQVIRMFCTVTHPDGTVLRSDTRAILAAAVQEAEEAGVHFDFGSELEFYLFKPSETDSNGREVYDRAGYLDVAPEDKGENIRREICLTLSQMGIQPESSHHEEGPGQNEIDFRYSDPMTAADNAITFRSVVKTISARYGLEADFSPKPLADSAGSGFHINISVRTDDGKDKLDHVIAGVLRRIREMTLFLDPCEGSYARLGSQKAPRYVTWSSENRSQLIRVPATDPEKRRMELRSPDPTANPYLAFALLIRAGLEGIREQLPLTDSTDCNLFTAPASVTERLTCLPASLSEAVAAAGESDFVRNCLPDAVIRSYSAM